MNPSFALRVACALVPLAGSAAAAAEPASGFDGALALVAQRGPDYLGARDYGASIRPGIFLRWGRVSISSGGSWAALRRDDEGVRGLGIELARTDELRVSLGLRVDSGRNESGSDALKGLGDVKRTVRARIGANWHFAPEWELGASWTVDAFRRGGGNLVETKLQHEWPLSARLQLTTGAALAVAGPVYMQTYYGVTEEQAARSGYPVYTPGTSLRDLQLYTTLRADIGERWVGLLGVGYSRALGDVLDSPLMQKPEAWTLTAGVGWRF